MEYFGLASSLGIAHGSSCVISVIVSLFTEDQSHQLTVLVYTELNNDDEEWKKFA